MSNDEQSKKESSFVEAREILHSVLEHIITHRVAHMAEDAAKGLIRVMKAPYPGTVLLRPHSVWWWRYAAGLGIAGRIIGSKAFGIATEVFKASNNTPGSSEEYRNMVRDDKIIAEREARIAAREPKVEQGIAYKNGSVYFPV